MGVKEIAVISDVHSNRIALDAVLDDVERRGIETIVNLGDSLFGPIAPVETAERLMNHPGMVNVMGNCDRYLLQEESESLTFQQVKPLLTEPVLKWMETFRPAYVYEDILFCHGTPASDETYLLEEVTPAGSRDKSVEKLRTELQEIPYGMIVCGHTHLPKLVYLPDGKQIVNPGSVGFPAYYEETPFPHVMESMSPHAKYAILSGTRGAWQVEQVYVPYDWERAAGLAEEKGRVDYAYAIRSGWAYIPEVK